MLFFDQNFTSAKLETELYVCSTEIAPVKENTTGGVAGDVATDVATCCRWCCKRCCYMLQVVLLQVAGGVAACCRWCLHGDGQTSVCNRSSQMSSSLSH